MRWPWTRRRPKVTAEAMDAMLTRVMWHPEVTESEAEEVRTLRLLNDTFAMLSRGETVPDERDREIRAAFNSLMTNLRSDLEVIQTGGPIPSERLLSLRTSVMDGYKIYLAATRGEPRSEGARHDPSHVQDPRRTCGPRAGDRPSA